MSALTTICAFLNLQGFQNKKLNRIREVGWLAKTSSAPFNFQVHPGPIPLHQDDVRVALMYSKYKIHGLNFFPKTTEYSIPQDEVHKIIYELYDSAMSPGCDVVAYCGEGMEKNLLDDLLIPNIDLQQIVPEFETWPDVQYYQRYNCGKHSNRDLGWQHCCSCKVMFYRDYVAMYCM